MAQRRPLPSGNSQDYYAVPQSPQSTGVQGSYNPARPPAMSSSVSSQVQMPPGRGAIAQGVASGQIGGAYGPYSYNPSTLREQPGSRFSAAPSEVSSYTGEKPAGPVGNSSTIPAYLWDTKDPDLDDALHNPDPRQDAALDRSFTLFSARGWLNAGALFILVVGLITLFAGYPIIHYYTTHEAASTGYNLGGINGSGQVPQLPGMPGLIDTSTPSSVMYRKGHDGYEYELVFSDEFNKDGRTFWPGDDPFWEAVDLHYWPTGDLEWYSPQSVTTKDGNLVLTVTEQPINNLNFMSGMLQSWNKLCFTTGYIEVNVSMPGTPQGPGFWPAIWTLGNLGRAGYGATTEGTWPYSYAACDLGTFPNQTDKSGNPTADATGSPSGDPLSFQPGQRVSACTCPGGDHPGPNVGVGRGVPEIDIFETQVDVSIFKGQVSQSFQVAPYNYEYVFTNTTPATNLIGATTGLETQFNSYTGSIYQQALSALSYISSSAYSGTGFATYGFEWWSDPNDRSSGQITWYAMGQPAWSITAASLAGDSTSQISSRIIPEEPVSIVMNLGLSPSFQEQDFQHMKFPSAMYIDYVRVYQRQGVKNGLTCDPPNYPTADYINNHMNAFTNPNLTTWAQAGYTFPRNSKYDGC